MLGNILVHCLAAKVLQPIFQIRWTSTNKPDLTDGYPLFFFFFFTVTTLLIDSLLSLSIPPSHHDSKCPGSQQNFLHRESFFHHWSVFLIFSHWCFWPLVNECGSILFADDLMLLALLQYFSCSKFSILAADVLQYIYMKTCYVVDFMISIMEHLLWFIYLYFSCG